MGYIGVVDSGVGGLTVLKNLPTYNYRYIADHAFCPYGNKSPITLLKRLSKIISYFKNSGAEAVVLACNTASVFANALSKRFAMPVYDVILPTCERALALTVSKRIALLATDNTIKSSAYRRILEKDSVKVIDFDCGSFVPFVENNSMATLSCQKTVYNALKKLPQADADVVILGCTHFPLLKRQICDFCKSSVIVESRVDMSNFTFGEHTSKNVCYFTTGDVDFANDAARWYGNIEFKRLNL